MTQNEPQGAPETDDMSDLATWTIPETALGTDGDHWNGSPYTPPDLTIKAWYIDPYWYVASSNGIFRVGSQDQVTTIGRLVFTVGEQARVLMLDQYRDPGLAERGAK